MAIKQNCKECSETGEYLCSGCRKGSCGKSEHIFSVYFVQRLGTPADNVGAKFFFYCGSCQSAICKSCLVQRRETVETLANPEYREILCPVCGYQVLPVRFDNKSYWEAADLFKEFLKFGGRNIEEGKLILPYEGWFNSLVIKPGTPGWISFSTQRPVEPGEAFEIRFGAGGKEYRLLHYKYPQPYSLLIEGNNTVFVGRYIFHSPASFGISADYDGALITNKGDEDIQWTKTGIISSRGLEILPEEVQPDTIPETPKRKMFRDKLKELTDKAIWDYQAMHSDKEREKGEFHIAGSTDLMYYHLVEMFFKKVSFTNLGTYFHHPIFELASPVIERQIRDLRGIFDQEQYIFQIRDDAGATGERRYFMCAEYLFVEYMG